QSDKAVERDHSNLPSVNYQIVTFPDAVQSGTPNSLNQDATQFPELQVPTLVTSQQSLIREFITEHGDVIVKPLDGMG
ncbi:hypothetical protein RFX73_00315, partial [Acinetobacter baumannii]|nr:hypothetical protein [Acinetobacter baumannii]